MASATSPVVYDLTVAGLPAKVKTSGVSADSDGFYYKAGKLVEISADETIKIAATEGAAIGVLEDSITTKTNPGGLDSRTRVTVLPFGYRRVVRMTAEGALSAGDRVCQGTVSKQAVKAMSDLAATTTPDASGLSAATTVDTSGLSGSIPSDSTPVTSDAAQPTVSIDGTATAETTLSGSVTAATTLAGGILPEKELGIVWKGATNGNEALILVY